MSRRAGLGAEHPRAHVAPGVCGGGEVVEQCRRYSRRRRRGDSTCGAPLSHVGTWARPDGPHLGRLLLCRSHSPPSDHAPGTPDTHAGGDTYGGVPRTVARASWGQQCRRHRAQRRRRVDEQSHAKPVRLRHDGHCCVAFRCCWVLGVHKLGCCAKDAARQGKGRARTDQAVKCWQCWSSGRTPSVPYCTHLLCSVAIHGMHT